MLKNTLIVLTAVVLILVGCGYAIYVNRAKIISKVVDYTVQSITGASDNSAQKDGDSSWVGALMGSGSDDMKAAVLDAVAKRGFGKADNQNNGSQKNTLATMAEMFMNGAIGEGNADIGQMAQALASTLQKKSASFDETQTEVRDINARDSKGRTLLMNVCRVDVTPKVIKMLLKYGADINAVDDNGRTAVMYAGALNQNIEVVQVLLDNGIKVDAEDNQGKKAYDYATDPEIKELLSSYTR